MKKILFFCDRAKLTLIVTMPACCMGKCTGLLERYSVTYIPVSRLHLGQSGVRLFERCVRRPHQCPAYSLSHGDLHRLVYRLGDGVCQHAFQNLQVSVQVLQSLLHFVSLFFLLAFSVILSEFLNL